MGVFKVMAEDIADSVKREEILHRIYEGNALVEECIQGCDQLQAFHPQSLNTVRVVTVKDGNEPKLFGSFFRMGRGDSVVDNAHAGGVFAHVDIEKGILDSDAITTDGEVFQHHPDTGIVIKGFQIPNWNLISETCKEAHRLCDNFIVGWDVTVNKNGEVDFIEGNHAPDMDLMQSPLKLGVRAEFERALSNFNR